MGKLKLKNRILKFTGVALFAGILFLIVELLIPRKYDVPEQIWRAGTNFWMLPTGSKIAYTLIPAMGNKKPNPIIYLHGGPGGSICNHHIEAFLPLAKDGFDIYFYDQFGCGLSDRLENIEKYTAQRHERDLEAIIEKIDANNVILIRQSWGAMLAVMYVTHHPEKVEKIIFTGPGPILPIKKERASIAPPDSLNLLAPHFSNQQGNQMAQNMRSRLITWWAWHFGQKLVSDREADAFATYLNSLLARSTFCDTTRVIRPVGGAGYFSQIMTVRSFSEVDDQRMALKNIGIPVLIMKGQCDNQKWGFTREYTELFSNHKLVIIPGAGHAISEEQPWLYLSTIRDFINP